jgi:hypothetical protein
MATTNSKNLTGEKYYKKLKDKDLKVSNELYDNQVKSINRDYDTQVFEQGKAYEDQYRENAVQKEINKRQVAESMANLGLTDSGLNRTQQTAVQLSYGNNKANIDRQRQSGIDNLNYSRRQALDTTEQNRLAANAQIEQGYAEKAAAYDENRKAEAKNIVLSYLELGAEPPKDMVALSGMSNSEIKAYKNYKKSIAAAKVTSSNKQKNSSVDEKKTKYKVRTFGGSKNDNGNNVYYFYDENGKKYSFPEGTNPYTGKPITGGYTTEELEHYGVWNGYQPKFVKYNGTNLGTVQKYATDNGTVQINHQGHMKTIWQTGDGSLWVWDDNVGNYVRAWDENGKIYFEESE